MASIELGTAITVPARRKRSRRLDATAVVSICWLVIVVAAAIFGSALTHYGATTAVPNGRLLSPSLEHLAGTDNFARDILDRLTVAARSSMIIGIGVGIASSVLGGVLGIAVVVWPKIDAPVMRVLDGLIAFPSIILAILLVTSFGAGSMQVIIALTIVYFPRITRVTRGITLSVVASPYVEAAGVIGGGRVWATWRHVVPNVVGPLGVQATYVISRAIVVDAAMSFLGLGVPPPAPTWGNMLGDARLYIDQAWWMVLAPGVCIMLTAVAINFAGDSLRDISDKTMESAR
ncbi:ABC transporter permease [Pedococcus sp. P5_B7]